MMPFMSIPDPTDFRLCSVKGEADAGGARLQGGALFQDVLEDMGVHNLRYRSVELLNRAWQMMKARGRIVGFRRSVNRNNENFIHFLLGEHPSRE